MLKAHGSKVYTHKISDLLNKSQVLSLRFVEGYRFSLLILVTLQPEKYNYTFGMHHLGQILDYDEMREFQNTGTKHNCMS